jgi:hypothetical protein
MVALSNRRDGRLYFLQVDCGILQLAGDRWAIPAGHGGGLGNDVRRGLKAHILQ